METTHTLASLRVRAGLTLEDAAPAFGVTRQTLANYEADSSHMPARLLNVAAHLYMIPRGEIFIGRADELAQHIREAARAESPC